MKIKKNLEEEIKYFNILKETAQTIKVLMDEITKESDSAAENIERILHILSSNSPDISGNVKTKLINPHFETLKKSSKKLESALGKFDKESFIWEWLPTESAENVRKEIKRSEE